MAAILRVRDQQGNIVDIPALVGPTDPPEPDADSPTWKETTNSRLASLESAVDALIVAQLEVSGNV